MCFITNGSLIHAYPGTSHGHRVGIVISNKLGGFGSSHPPPPSLQNTSPDALALFPLLWWGVRLGVRNLKQPLGSRDHLYFSKHAPSDISLGLITLWSFADTLNSIWPYQPISHRTLTNRHGSFWWRISEGSPCDVFTALIYVGLLKRYLLILTVGIYGARSWLVSQPGFLFF